MSRAVAVADRVPLDARLTPRPLALAITRALADRCRAELSAGDALRILEPSCGPGAFVRAAKATWPRSRIDAIDVADYKDKALAAGAAEFRQQDCATLSEPNAYNLILGNPPFTYAEQHVRALLPLLVPGGRLAFLLRINFYGSSSRAGAPKRGRKPRAAEPTNLLAEEVRSFWQEFPEDEFWPIAPRPSFGRNKAGKKGTDGTEYAVFIWHAKREARRYRGDHIIWAPDPDEPEELGQAEPYGDTNAHLKGPAADIGGEAEPRKPAKLSVEAALAAAAAPPQQHIAGIVDEDFVI